MTEENKEITEQPIVSQEAAVEQTTQEPAKDRTREQFDKLIESNKRLFEANELLRQEMQARTKVNETFKPIQENTADPFDGLVVVNPETGERLINDEKLLKQLRDNEQRATRAEKAVESYVRATEEKEIAAQNQAAFNQYPELNPGDKSFDLTFHRQVRGALYDSMVNAPDYGGKPMTFKEAADFVRGASSGQKKDLEKKEQEISENKQQAVAHTTSQPASQAQGQFKTEEQEKLVQRVRYGDNSAIVQRLESIGHTSKEE